ncbi:molybdopterin-dependent oxidoreductase [Paludibacterium paludis]|uniref:Oxidoreductase molybdopterin-binding domain-containing protein n=1 Tax=Paludibacterium paludis TaxID=1225769 RepID=A0A918U9C4_9NEIS|nr:molybdopterin-dependent oxidoreductase [Paludibacterium paludis]GGY13024.1 hypothetical protein GCM10011289_15260 [Paludibacterium paludis]
MDLLRRSLLVAAFCLPLSVSAFTVKLIPSVTGHILLDERNARALGVATITTATQWTAAAHRWSGLPLSTLLDRYGRMARHVRVRALNDYEVSIPAEEIRRYAPVLATQMDSRPIAVRDKGPVILVWPFDRYEAVNQRQRYHDWAVWHVSEIVFQ